MAAPIASRARTSFAIAAAGAALAGGLVLRPGSAARTHGIAEHSDIIHAAFGSTKIIRGEQDIAVTISMPGPGSGEQARPPVSLVMVLDRSGSMHGVPLENAKAAARTLVGSIGPNDAFSLVTFSDKAEVVSAMATADGAHKREALNMIDSIVDDGGTCTSCGIETGATQLAMTPIKTGVKRMVLLSDGQANEGLWDRDELVGLAASTAAHGISITTVGVGLDFDEQTMIRLGESGRGNYYFVDDTAKLAAMFSTELDGLARTTATNVVLQIDEVPGTNIESAYGYPMTRDRNHLYIPIADLRAGETRKVVLRSRIDANDYEYAAHFGLWWNNPSDNAQLHEGTMLAATLTTSIADVNSSRDLAATAAIEEAHTAQAIEQATATYEQYGPEAAQRVIDQQLTHVRNMHVSGENLDRIQRAADGAVHSFTVGGQAAQKTTRTSAYELAR